MTASEQNQQTEETQSVDQRSFFQRNKRWLISLSVFSTIIVVLVAMSYLWLPGYAKSQLEIRLSELLQRSVKVGAIEFKLHNLELIVHDFSIDEKASDAKDNNQLFSLGKLYVDVSIESIKHRAPVITSLVLTDPKVRLGRDVNNRLSIADLIEKFSQPSESDDTEKGPPLKFSVSHIKMENGYFEFDDQFKLSNHKISEINLGIPVIANFESTVTNWIEPHFNAKINDSPFSLTGKLRPFTEKQEATLAIKLDELDLAQLDNYVTLPNGISFNSGFLDTDLLVTFTHTPEKTPDVILSGEANLTRFAMKNATVEEPYRAQFKQMKIDLASVDLMMQKSSKLTLKIDDIALTPVDDKTPALSLENLTIDQIGIDMNKHEVELDDITLDRLRTTLRRDTTGNIDLMRLFQPAGSVARNKEAESKPAAKASPSKAARAKTQPKAVAKVKATQMKLARVPLPGRKPDPNNPVQVQIADSDTAKDSSKEVQNDTEKAARADKVDVPPKEDKKAVANDAPWTVQIKSIKLEQSALRYEDLNLTKTPPMVVDQLEIKVNDIDLEGIKPLKLSVKARINERGKLKVDGNLAWAPLDTNLMLDLDSVNLVPLQGLAGNKLNALITGGDVSFLGNVKAQQKPVLQFHVNGDAKLYNLHVFDEKNAHDLLNWKKLDITALKVVNNPMRIDMNTVTFSDFYARAVLLPTGKLNLVEIVNVDKNIEVDVDSADNKNAVEVKVTTTEKNPKNPQVNPEKETVIQIAKVLLQRGNVNFHDRFIKPNYRANLTGLNGQIGPLFPGKFGVIDVRGAVDKTAPLEIKGKIEPFSEEFFLDLTARVKEIDLPPFSPYSGKYVGYAIQKGKLSADVTYHVEKGNLTADNKIFIDQFTLGEKIPSENAVSLPLDLAISLLKNRKGEINLHLPLQGTINDPQFNLGGLIFDAFVNLMTKAITAPFTLIASMFEGGEELSTIAFTPGFADINEEAAKRLQSLSEIMTDKSELKLEITGFADAEQDHDGLKLALLQDKVKAQKLAVQTEKGVTSGALGDIKLTPEEYSKYLTVAYKKEKFEKPKNVVGLTKSLPDAEMEHLMLQHIQITENELATLAEQRAISAHNWLIENGGVQDERIFIVSASQNDKVEEKKGGRVEFMLK
ncbi:MAG: DUF748 domain-containing protein [Nitrosomonas sp.]